MFRHVKHFAEIHRRRLIQAAAVSSAMTGYYVYHLEPTPVTGPWHLLICRKEKVCGHFT